MPAAAAALECRGLTLDYGNGTVIGPIDLRLEPGDCVALVGPNGAGKTTFLHMALGLRRPTQGEVLVSGRPASDPRARVGIGYLQEAVDFPERERAHALLGLHCRLTGACDSGDRGRLEAYLEGFGLEWTRKPLRIYSKGMKQRLALALAMLDCGRMLVLDEPNSGLDPVGIAMLRQKLEDAKRARSTLLLSTHRLAESMRLADRVVVLHRGRISGDAPMSDFQDYAALEKFFLGCVR
jgi:ABC-2 type transport system ATP-binding protein